MTSMSQIIREAPDEERFDVSRRLSPRRWATEVAKIKLPKTGALKFDTHPFLPALYDDLHPEIVVIKGAQLGFSTWSISRTLWAATQFWMSTLYTFPSRTDVSEFTQARINPIIRSSQFLAERIVDVDSVQVKQFSRTPAAEYKRLRRQGLSEEEARISTIYFGGASTEKDAQSRDVDLLIHDEEDRSNPQVIEQMSDRLSASKLAWRIRLSTPTIPGKGVDRTWSTSDQRAWMHRCSRCNAWFEMAFPDGRGDTRGCILPERWDPEWGDDAWQAGTDKVQYICPKCRQPLREEDRATGQWATAFPDRWVHGYHVSQMSAPWISAPQILFAFFKATWESDFWNLKMGLPWEEGTNAMTRAAILGPPGTGRTDPNREQELSSDSGTVMGVDVGAKFDVVVERVEGGSPRVIRIARLDSWEQVSEYMTLYNVRMCVIDAAPEEHATRLFQESFRPGRVWRCVYDSGKAKQVVWQEKSGYVVKAPREPLLTACSKELLEGKLLPRFDGSSDYEAFVQHHVNSKRVPIWIEGLEAERIVDKYEWHEVGPDHMFHASAYAMLARWGYKVEGVPTVGLVSLNRSSKYNRQEGGQQMGGPELANDPTQPFGIGRRSR